MLGMHSTVPHEEAAIRPPLPLRWLRRVLLTVLAGFVLYGAERGAHGSTILPLLLSAAWLIALLLIVALVRGGAATDANRQVRLESARRDVA